MPYFISCDVPPEDFGSVVRCPNFSGGNSVIYANEQELLNALGISQTIPTNGANSSIDMDTDFISFLVYTFCFFAMVFGFKAGSQR